MLRFEKEFRDAQQARTEFHVQAVSFKSGGSGFQSAGVQQIFTAAFFPSPFRLK